MSLSIGLEALNRNQGTTAISFEAAYSDAMEASLALQDEIQHGIDLMNLLDNVSAIRKSVKRFGFSKSVESLIGHKLGSTRVSVEETATTTERSTWEKIVDWFKKIWRHIQDWFAKHFRTRRGVMLRLQEIKDGNYKVRDAAKTFDGYEATEINTIKTKMSGLTSAMFNNPDSAQNQLNEIPSTKEVKIADDAGVKSYATTMLDALKDIDKIERQMKVAHSEALREAQRGLGKPSEDIDSVRDKQKAFGIVSKAVTKIVNGLFKSARAFLRYVKK